MKSIKKFMLFLLLLIWLAACGKSTEQQISEQLQLGQKYLAELDYENAIVTFQKVIEIAPKELAAYISLADIYTEKQDYSSSINILKDGVKIQELFSEDESNDEIRELFRYMEQMLADQYIYLAEETVKEGNFEEGIKYFEQALQYENSEEIYLKIAEIYESQGDFDQVLQILRQGIEKSGGVTCKERLKEIEEEIELERLSEELMVQIVQMYGQEGEVKLDLFQNDDFQKLLKLLKEPQFFQQQDSSYIGIYPSRSLYIGEMESGMRVGQGTWYFDTKNFVFISHGEWKDNYPNGYFISEEFKKADNSLVVSKKGTCTNGYFDGEIIAEWAISGTIYQYHANMGIAEVIEIDENGRKIVAKAGNAVMTVGGGMSEVIRGATK